MVSESVSEDIQAAIDGMTQWLLRQPPIREARKLGATDIAMYGTVRPETMNEIRKSIAEFFDGDMK